MQMNAKAAVIIAAFAVAFCSLAQSTNSQPHQFLVRPGSPEWRTLKSTDDMYQACDIAEGTVKKLTTKALVQTCLDYPLRHLVLSDSESANRGLSMVAERFSGFRELSRRPDAGVHLFEAYAVRTQQAKSAGKAPQYIDHVTILALLSKKEVLAALSVSQKQTLVRYALQNMKLSRNVHGFTADEGPPGRLATKLLMDHAVTFDVRGQIVDGSALDKPQARDFVREDLDFFPEQRFMDTLLGLLDRIEGK
jgi:hypothetical protein